MVFAELEIFLSTLPARGATWTLLQKIMGLFISIHAPREGSDRETAYHTEQPGKHFYPRSPRGERPGSRVFPPFI